MRVTSNTGVQGTGQVGNGDGTVSKAGRFLETKAAGRIISNFGDRTPVYNNPSPGAFGIAKANSTETARV